MGEHPSPAPGRLVHAVRVGTLGHGRLVTFRSVLVRTFGGKPVLAPSTRPTHQALLPQRSFDPDSSVTRSNAWGREDVSTESVPAVALLTRLVGAWHRVWPFGRGFSAPTTSA